MAKKFLTWQDLYKVEEQLKENIGCKQRFVLLSKHIKQANISVGSPQILDGGGCNFTSLILKKIFPGSTIVSVNIEGKNDIADVSIKGDLCDYEKIIKNSQIDKFDIIFLGEVFEHIVKPYSVLKNLVKLIKPGGCLIITTPNLANIYNRILLLMGHALYNYRPIGIKPNEDHITVVSKKQMLNLLRNELKLEIITVDGYSYYERKIINKPKNDFSKSGQKLKIARGLINKVLPVSLREGVLYIAKTSER
ncbi:methyltransferase domain-containing protein [Candidatus Omnitrophota bacterium]